MNFDPVTEAVLKRRKEYEESDRLNAKARAEFEETMYRRENLFTSFDDNPPRAICTPARRIFSPPKPGRG